MLTLRRALRWAVAHARPRRIEPPSPGSASRSPRQFDWLVRVLASLCVIACPHFAAASVEAPKQDYDITGLALDDALNVVASRSHVQIIFDAKLLGGRRAANLVGRFSVSEALQKLLDGSGLEAVPVNADTYAIKRSKKPSRKLQSPKAPATKPDDPDSVELSGIVVRGDQERISNLESTYPVTTIDREQIEASGYTTLFDLLRSQPGVQVANLPETMASSSQSAFTAGASGAAAVALRHLGANSTLVLVDGRRMAGYGIASQNATGNVPDLSGIPLAIVDRIEILRDGASAIYGSDAIGGVINIVLRRDFAGVDVDVYSGVSSRGDAATQQLSATWGGKTASGMHVLLSADYRDSSALTGSQRDWYTLDQSRHGLLDLRSIYSFPGNYLYANPDGSTSYVARTGCAPANLSGGACLLDSAKYTTLQNGEIEKTLLGRFDVPLGESLRAYADLRLTDVVQRQQAAPSGASFAQGPSNGVPRDDAQPLAFFYGFGDVGPVRETTKATIASVVAGLSGESAAWAWNASVTHETLEVDDIIDGLLRSSALNESIANGTYTFGDEPLSSYLRGLISPRVQRTGETTLDVVEGEASRVLFELPAGAVALHAGAQVRRDGLEQRPDAILRSGDLLNQAPEYAMSSHRSASSAYANLDVPIAGGLTLSSVGRIDRTAGFQTRFSPTVGVRWNPTAELTFRASASKGYRPPTLLELNQSPGSGGQQIYMLPQSLGPCATTIATSPGQIWCEVLVNIVRNRELQPEKSTTRAAGVVWEPSPEFGASMDVYRSERRNEIATLPATYAFNHPDAFPDFILRDSLGNIVALDTRLVNIGLTTTSGVDVEAHWDAAYANADRLRIGIGLNYLARLDSTPTPGGERLREAGYSNAPRLTGVASLRWAAGDWITSMNVRYTGSYSNDSYAGAGNECPVYKAQAGKCTTPPFVLVNSTVAYTGLSPWTFSVSVDNLFDHAPHYYEESFGGYNPQFDDPVGRYYGLRVDYRF